MASMLRNTLRVPRARALPSFTQSRRWATQDYGSKQSGHPQGINEANPKRHLEHPGPEAPATKDPGLSSSASSSSSSSSSSTSTDAKPKIQEPYSAKEDSDPEVKKHNEEMRNRHERTANQLGEKDNKVDKDFWKGD